ncbi:MAG: hypothetical protein HRU19_24250 [Pseudobacteriovorax sp.]|nr:hypothetical protein [Pseudobacteriovorax sp.]
MTVTKSKVAPSFQGVQEAKNYRIADILALGIAESSQSRNLIGIEQSGQAYHIKLPNCFQCRATDFKMTSNGVYLKGEFSLEQGTDLSAQFSLAYWDYESLHPLFSKPISRWHLVGEDIAFESSHQNKLFLMNHQGATLMEIGTDSWEDFVVMLSKKVLVAAREVWPTIHDDNIFKIENGENLVSGERFVLETGYIPHQNPPSLRCQVKQHYWRQFTASDKRIYRSIVPAPLNSGSRILQKDHHIFLLNSDSSEVFAISKYAEIPHFRDFHNHKLEKVDSLNQIVFDGFNLLKYSAKTSQDLTPYLKVKYEFNDLDYVIRVYGRHAGFNKKIIGQTKDGYLTEISRNGTINYKSKKKVDHQSPSTLRFFLLKAKTVAYSQSDQGLYSVVESDKSFDLRLIHTLDSLPAKKEFLVLNDKLIIKAGMELFYLDDQKIVPITRDLCHVIAMDSFEKQSINTVEVCDNKAFLRNYIAGKEFKLNSSLRYPRLDSFTSRYKKTEIWMHSNKDRFRLTRHNPNKCTNSSLVFHKNPELVILPTGRQDTETKSARFEEGQIKGVFSIKPDSFLITVASGLTQNNYLFISGRKHSQITGLDGKRVDSIKRINNDEVLIAASERGKSQIYFLNTKSLVLTKIEGRRDQIILSLGSINSQDDGNGLDLSN